MPLLALLAGALATPVAVARVAQVAERARDAESGHTYVRSAEPLTFYDAEALARAMGGTLVTIGSSAEEIFLLENFGGSEGYWIGLEYPRWQWVTGERVAYTHWSTAEPDGGAGEPFTLLNWGEPGLWVDASGDAETQRFRALIELPAGLTPLEVTAPLAQPVARRGVLLCTIEGLSAKDLQNPRNPSLNALWKRSAWRLDAGADWSGDPLADLGMIVWGVGSSRSRLTSPNLAGAARGHENLLSRIESIRPEVTTVALLDDAALTGLLLEGRMDLRVSDASPRKGGSQAPVASALARATPLCILAAWTRVLEKEEIAAGRAKEIAAIDGELGVILKALEARPEYASEEWWIAVAGLGSVREETKDGPLAGAIAALCLVAPTVVPGELRDEAALVDLLPSALAHLGIDARPSWQVDGRALTPGAPRAFGTNLIANGDAEAQFGWSAGPSWITGWRTLAPFRVARHAEGERERHGESYFEGAGEQLARLEQGIDLGSFAADIDGGVVRYQLAGWLGTGKESRASIECAVEFLSEQEKTLERAMLGPVGLNERRSGLVAAKGVPIEGLIERRVSGRVPRRTRAARIVLLASGSGDVALTMADDLSLVLERE